MSVGKGRLWIVASPSGGGKTSLVEAILDRVEDIVSSVSYTTREQRDGEIDGKDYIFISKEAFEQQIFEKKMLEFERVYGNYYGTGLASINNHLSEGKDVVLTIDWQGARQVKLLIPESNSIFILPPRIEDLEKRLMKRSQDSKDVIDQRMAEAKEQVSHYKEFDYLIFNDDFEIALQEMITVFKADRLSRKRHEKTRSDVISSLLS